MNIVEIVFGIIGMAIAALVVVAMLCTAFYVVMETYLYWRGGR